MVAEQFRHAAGFLAVAALRRRGLVQRAAQQQRHHGGNRANHERNAPAPGPEFGLVEQLLKHHHHQHRQQLAADQRHVLERREEPTPALERHFTHIGGSCAVFATYGQALQQSRQQQQRRGEGADGGVGRQAGDQQRAEAHHHHRDQHRVLAPVAVRDAAEQPAADRSHQEAGGKHARSVQQLGGRVGFREERRREIDGAERVDIEIEPFDEVAGRSGNNREDAFPGLLWGGCRGGIGG
ncbi:hypothetical protein D3C87_1285290 [compost metagenome]